MVGEVIAERYELEELIGSGGAASVFRAHDRLLERTVALKILRDRHAGDADYVERFRREARAAAQLSHPNIVTLLDRGEDGGRQYIVFEYVDGENLKRLVERRGALSARAALELAIQVGRALAFAHAQGLVHRDVKPQNVLLAEGSRAKVTDFGLARTLEAGGLTQTGTVLGTSDYISPEQASGRRADSRSDVYSLGAVLYELLTGEVPFPGGNPVSVALRHVGDPPPSPAARQPGVPSRLDEAVRTAMAKDPAERFQSMDAFVAELETCRAELGPDAETEATVILRRPRRRWRRAALAVPAGAAVALAAAATAALVWLQGDGGSPGSTPIGAPVRVAAVASYDPNGDGHEHDERIALATDGDPSTYWETERYVSFTKPGVGIVVDAGRAVSLRRLEVRTDTPGFVARIEAGDSLSGPFAPVSASETVGDSTRFSLEIPSSRRYYLIWITKLAPGFARTHVNEVTPV